MQYYHFRELVNDKELEVEQVSSAMMLANRMTKALIVNLLKKHRVLLGIVQ